MFNNFPFRVTLLLCLVLIFTAWNILRISTALSWQATLNEFNIQPTVWVIVVSGIFWALTGLILIWSIWQEKAWAKKMLLGAVAGYTIWYWSERFFLWQMPRPNVLFAVILNLVFVLIILFTIKSLTREAYERES